MTKNIILQQKKSKKAFKIHQEIISLKETAASAFVLMGQRLNEIKEKNLYRFLGDGGYETFESYLASPELQFDRRKAYYLIQIYKTFCEDFKIDKEEVSKIYWTTLRQILPVVNKENCSEWLNKAKTLSRNDLNMEIKQIQSGIDPRKCNHEWNEKIYWQCKKCGERSYVDPDQIQQNKIPR